MPDDEDLEVPEEANGPRIDGHGWAVDLRVNKDTSAEQKLEYGERTEEKRRIGFRYRIYGEIPSGV